MKKNIYRSKKQGEISILTDGNDVTMKSSRLEFKSLNQLPFAPLVDAYSCLLSDPKNIELFQEGVVWCETKVNYFLSSEVKKWNDGQQLGVFAVLHLDSQKFMGSLNINYVLNDYAQIGKGHKNAIEMGYVLDKSCWGAGYGTEIAIVGKKYIKHVCQQLQEAGVKNLPSEIVATVHPSNTGSKKILEKTLKEQEVASFAKFNGQPRILFFKSLNPKLVSQNEESSDLKSKL